VALQDGKALLAASTAAAMSEAEERGVDPSFSPVAGLITGRKSSAVEEVHRPSMKLVMGGKSVRDSVDADGTVLSSV
jgi:hypothetical protein